MTYPHTLESSNDPRFAGRDMSHEMKLLAKYTGAESCSFTGDRAVLWVKRPKLTPTDPDMQDPVYLDPAGGFWINLVATLEKLG
jgi:hypothetical protein